MTLGELSCKDIHDVFTGGKFADSVVEHCSSFFKLHMQKLEQILPSIYVYGL